jgi:hypothetical protein
LFGTHPGGSILFAIYEDMKFLKLNLVGISCCLTIGLYSLLIEVHDLTFSKHIIANLSELMWCGRYGTHEKKIQEATQMAWPVERPFYSEEVKQVVLGSKRRKWAMTRER